MSTELEVVEGMRGEYQVRWLEKPYLAGADEQERAVLGTVG